MKWRAWYDDGRVFSSAETEWSELPAKGIVGVVVYREPPYRDLVTQGDWYWLDGGEVRKVLAHPEWGQWAPKPDVPAGVLKQSGAMDPEAYDSVLADMMAAREWP